MEKTTYYNLNIVEGTDIVNPLVVDNPNYEKIDDSMHANAVNGVTLATEIANARVHALTRANSECAVIRFIATSNWMSGDTMTVDGVSVTPRLPSGEFLPDGAYVINANVLCILTGSNLTVYAERKRTDNASDITYNDTTVAEALDTINSNLSYSTKDLLIRSASGNTPHPLNIDEYKKLVVEVVAPSAGNDMQIFDINTLKVIGGITSTFSSSYAQDFAYGFRAQIVISITPTASNIRLYDSYRGTGAGELIFNVFGIK